MASRAGRIDDAGRVRLRARPEFGRARPAKSLPAHAAREIGIWRRFGHEHRPQFVLAKRGRLRDGAPQRILDKQNLRFRVREQLKMFGGGEFVIERNENAAREKYGVRRNQPLGLIGHDDRGAISRGKARFFESGRHGLGGFAKLPVGEAGALVVAVRFDQADFLGPVSERIAQRRSQRIVFRQIKHQNCRRGTEKHREARQDYMRNSPEESFYSAWSLRALPGCAWRACGSR